MNLNNAVSETKNSEEFLQIYNKLEKYLKDKLDIQKHTPFWMLVNIAAKNNKVIKEVKDELINYSKLRNAIVHSESNKTMAEPHNEALKRFTELYELIVKPPRAIELFGKEVYICSPDDILLNVVSRMKEYNYTQVPVYDGNKLSGLLTGFCIVKWLGSISNTGVKICVETKVSVLKSFIQEESYKVVSKDTGVYDILDDFLKFTRDQKKLVCVVITENGTNEELPIGIVTSWDLSLIKELS